MTQPETSVARYSRLTAENERLRADLERWQQMARDFNADGAHWKAETGRFGKQVAEYRREVDRHAATNDALAARLRRFEVALRRIVAEVDEPLAVAYQIARNALKDDA
jgi:hypothetical protein